jgi:hypothetical protein
MKGFFQTIKNKKNKRLLGVLWLFLIVMELFCPVLCDEPTFAVEAFNARTSITVNSSEATDEAENKSISVSDQQTQNEQRTVCNDECLCHATAIPNTNISTLKQLVANSEQIAFSSANPVFGSLSPPHRPPKIS